MQNLFQIAITSASFTDAYAYMIVYVYMYSTVIPMKIDRTVYIITILVEIHLFFLGDHMYDLDTLPAPDFTLAISGNSSHWLYATAETIHGFLESPPISPLFPQLV